MKGQHIFDRLPAWASVLVVVAHPDDESFGLGAVIDTFVTSGSSVSVLCLTRGEASTLHGVDGDLAQIRADELGAAATALGITRVHLAAYPDGGLTGVPGPELINLVVETARSSGAEGLLVFDLSGVTGHPDHIRATEIAVLAGEQLMLGVLGWTLPIAVSAALAEDFGTAFVGHRPEAIDLVVSVHRERQLRAVTCHPSQAVPGSVLWRRLELLGDREHLRWARTPGPV